MERKKKLQLARQAAEAKLNEESSEPATKRPKIGSDEKADAPATDNTSTTSPLPTSPSPVPQVMEAESKDNADGDEGEDGEVAEEPATEAAEANEEKPAVANPFAATGKPSGFGIVASSFGGTAAPFGSGQTPVFGSSAATTLPTGSAFGTKPAAKDASGGGAFLNITPPGAQAAPPTFAFGSSGSITLPTPSIAARSSSGSSPFGMFAPSGGGFGVFGASAGGAKPLFGSPPAATSPAPAPEGESKQEGETQEEKEGSEIV